MHEEGLVEREELSGIELRPLEREPARPEQERLGVVRFGLLIGSVVVTDPLEERQPNLLEHVAKVVGREQAALLGRGIDRIDHEQLEREDLPVIRGLVWNMFVSEERRQERAIAKIEAAARAEALSSVMGHGHRRE